MVLTDQAGNLPPPGKNVLTHVDPPIGVTTDGAVKIAPGAALADLLTSIASEISGMIGGQVVWHDFENTTHAEPVSIVEDTDVAPDTRVVAMVIYAPTSNTLYVKHGPNDQTRLELVPGTEYVVPAVNAHSFEIGQWYFWANGDTSQTIHVMYACAATGTIGGKIKWHEFTNTAGGTVRQITGGTGIHPSTQAVALVMRAPFSNTASIQHGPTDNVLHNLMPGTEYMVPLVGTCAFELGNWYFCAAGAEGQSLCVMYATVLSGLIAGQITWDETSNTSGETVKPVAEGMDPSVRVVAMVLHAPLSNTRIINHGPTEDVSHELAPGTEYSVPVISTYSFPLLQWYFWADGDTHQVINVMYAAKN